MVERDVIERILVQLEEYLRDLEEVKANYKLSDYLNDKIIRRYTERTLQVAIEACLDLAAHIISYEGLREPLDNKDCFQVLLENQIIPEELTNRLKRMAQFRNVVVHDYIRIKPEIVYAIVQNNIPDIVAFAQHIEKKYLDN
ncbi:MAG: type VII toxin-antitoxin system HepT family RNase toxin [Bacillota bacterium]